MSTPRGSSTTGLIYDQQKATASMGQAELTVPSGACRRCGTEARGVPSVEDVTFSQSHGEGGVLRDVSLGLFLRCTSCDERLRGIQLLWSAIDAVGNHERLADQHTVWDEDENLELLSDAPVVTA